MELVSTLLTVLYKSMEWKRYDDKIWYFYEKFKRKKYSKFQFSTDR